MRALLRRAGVTLLALLALECAPSALLATTAAQESHEAGAAAARPLSLDALLSPQDRFPVPRGRRPFLCENAGFLREHLPLSFVADGVCDCCDGSDERVTAAGGANPFFASKAGAAAAQPQQAESGAGSGWGWSLGLLGGGGSGGGAASLQSDPSPCPNTCAERARDFLSAMEKRVDEYAAGVDAKAARVRGVKAMRKRMAQQAQRAQTALAATAEAFRAAQAGMQSRTPGGGGDDHASGVATLRRLQQQGNALQTELEQTRWLLGETVASAHDRRVARPPGNFGAEGEWLLLAGRCHEHAWPQRRSGAFGERVDWYLMRLCPLANATQTAWHKTAPLPAREGAKWREAASAPQPVPVSAPVPAAVSEQQTEVEAEAEEAEPQQWSLGYWTGEIVSQQQEEPDAAAAATAAAGASSTPPGSVRSSIPEPSFLLVLRDGDSCWQVGPRQTDVSLRCGRADEFISVVEDGKCRYRMALATPLACQRNHLALLRQQLDEHRRWFMRRHPKPLPPPTWEQLLHDEL